VASAAKKSKSIIVRAPAASKHSALREKDQHNGSASSGTQRVAT